MKYAKTAGIAATGIAAVTLAACAPATVSKSADQSAPAKSSPASSPSSATSGPVGTTFTVSAQNDQGKDITYDITLTAVDQHASLEQYMSLDKPGDHMAAAKFTVKGGTGQESDDANNDAVAIGTDTTEYQTSLNGVADGGNFNAGEFAVSPGETVSGWVTFELPQGQDVKSVQWSPSSGLGDSHATWTVE